MHGQWMLLVASAVAFAGCGASCKRPPEQATQQQEATLVELPGVSTSQLVVSEKQIFSKVVQSATSPCGEPITLEVCVKENRPCKKCLLAARATATLVSRGMAEREIREWLTVRFDNASVQQLDIGRSPTQGPATAPVTIVEFADYQCPHCADRAPVIHAIVSDAEFAGKVRFVFKNYPLPQHEHADEAARASLAADNQGKFWQMHDLLFAHQDNLNATEIEGFAKQLGLDLDKFRADMRSAETKDRVARDRELGQKVGIDGTPSFFVGGRRFLPSGHGDFPEQMRDWLRVEFAMLEGRGS